MVIKSLKQVKDDFYEIIVESDHGEFFRKRKKYDIDKIKYMIYDVTLLYENSKPDVYKLTARKLKQHTIFNYDDIEFTWVFSIDRVNATQIQIVSENRTSTYTFKTKEECLNEYLLLQRLRSENNGTTEDNRLE
jgi:hypothetical protein